MRAYDVHIIDGTFYHDDVIVWLQPLDLLKALCTTCAHHRHGRVPDHVSRHADHRHSTFKLLGTFTACHSQLAKQLQIACVMHG